MSEYRTEKDSMGEVKVPKQALYRAQTQRAIDNFPISGQTMPAGFIRALGLIKAAAASSNKELGLLDESIAQAVETAALSIATGEHLDAFPVDVFQTGSGTSSNMNANEVIASLSTKALGSDIHPNDHVNMGQSSNDVVPTAIHLSAAQATVKTLQPALHHLLNTLNQRADELDQYTTTGRTHLMDAMPVTLGQELRAWHNQLQNADKRIQTALEGLYPLPQGGTAVGTGVNTHPQFGSKVANYLAQHTGLPFTPLANPFEGMSAVDAPVGLSAQLRGLAVCLMKISNDLRWMNSGPLAGLGEITLPALQPGSSIMPGKVNPVIPEAVCMVCTQVFGYDTATAMAGQSGNFQLNVMLPLVAWNLNHSIDLLANAMNVLSDKAISGFQVNHEKLNEALARNPILVTALNPVIGYEKSAEIAKQAYATKRPVKDVALALSGLEEKELDSLLDPRKLTGAD